MTIEKHCPFMLSDKPLNKPSIILNGNEYSHHERMRSGSLLVNSHNFLSTGCSSMEGMKSYNMDGEILLIFSQGFSKNLEDLKNYKK